jgi:preprotein translocase subunit SecE
MSPLNFINEVRDELTRVTWPVRSEVIEATAGVIFFVAVIAIYFWIADFIFSKALQLII